MCHADFHGEEAGAAAMSFECEFLHFEVEVESFRSFSIDLTALSLSSEGLHPIKTLFL